MVAANCPHEGQKTDFTTAAVLSKFNRPVSGISAGVIMITAQWLSRTSRTEQAVVLSFPSQRSFGLTRLFLKNEQLLFYAPTRSFQEASRVQESVSRTSSDGVRLFVPRDHA